MQLERKPNKIAVNCLAFADDIALITGSLESEQKQIIKLQRQVAKVGL